MRRFECSFGCILGSDWVIEMGVPVLIGTCSQASGGGGGNLSSFSFGQFNIVTVSYGSTPTEIPKGQVVDTILNEGNAYIIPNDGVFFNYSFSTPVRVNHEFIITYNTFLIVENELPPDGECEYTITFEATTGEGFQVFSLNENDPLNPDPQQAVSLNFGRLNRSDIIGEGGGFFSQSQTRPLRFADDGEPFATLRFALFDTATIDVTLSILLADGSSITQTQTMIQTELSCQNVLV